MLVLDTDALSLVQLTRSAEGARIRERIRLSGRPEFVTIVSFEEQTRGWLKYLAGANTPAKQVAAYARLRSLLDDFRTRAVLDFDDRASAAFQRLKAAKVRVSTSDLRIAAIMLANNATLITKNLSHFAQVPDLRAEDWTR